MKKPQLFVLLVIAFLAFQMAAQASPIFPYAYQIKDLKNGLRVMVIPTEFPNLVSLQIPVMVGSRNEVDAGRTGFAHFFEHMMFRGTENYPAKEYSEFFVKLGAATNAYTWTDYTNYHATFDKSALEEVLKIEADRFKNLRFSEADIKTEAGAVMGEYNKSAANPMQKVYEKEVALAFKTHPYGHQVIGYYDDIVAMPQQFAHSQTFFKRYYRPERTMVIVAGAVEPQKVFQLVEKYWGDWPRGTTVDQILPEKSFSGPHYAHVEAKSKVEPTLSLTFVGPAFSLESIDSAVMELLQSVLVAKSSKLYQELKIEKAWVDELSGFYMHTLDPHLFSIEARVSDAKNFWSVRDRILDEIAELRAKPMDGATLEDIKSNRKYQFAHSLDNTESIAKALFYPFYPVRDPAWINRHYQNFDRIAPSDIQRVANQYFVDNRMQTVSLSQEALPKADSPATSLDALVAKKAAIAGAQPFRLIQLKSSSPLIDFKIQFRVGAAFDPKGKEGLAHLTAVMLAEGDSRTRTYAQLQKALFPLAGELDVTVDKEMTTFGGTIHQDHAESYFQLVADQILKPEWNEAAFKRIKSNIRSQIVTDLRNNNEEELAKEVLYEDIYKNHPYGHLNMGHTGSLDKITLAEVSQFYLSHFHRGNLVLGLSGNASRPLLTNLRERMGELPEGEREKLALPLPRKTEGASWHLIEKETQSAAISLGFPIDVNRAHPDFVALWLAQSYLGEHRSFVGRLMERMRELRGLNYGDYAYIEYFPGGMFRNIPENNRARSQQIFQIWVRPVAPQNTLFSIRLALFELNKLLKEGISENDFGKIRGFLNNYLSILAKTQERSLGYALDGDFYGWTKEFVTYVREQLSKLTAVQVNLAIRKHLQSSDLQIVVITKNAQKLKDQLLDLKPTPTSYPVEKSSEILEEDKLVASYPFEISKDRVIVAKAEDLFQ